MGGLADGRARQSMMGRKGWVRMAARFLGFAIAAMTFATAAAQTPSSPLAFEVASIKRNQSGDDLAEGGFQPGGRINARNVTLVNLIVAAYALPPDRIEGGPSWVNTDRFDVVAVGNRNASVA